MAFVHVDDVLLQFASRVQQSRYTPTSAAAVYMCTSRREVNAEMWAKKHSKASSSIRKERMKEKRRKYINMHPNKKRLNEGQAGEQVCLC